MRKLGKRTPSTIKSFINLHGGSTTKGALSKNLALGIAITVRCDGCITCHLSNRLNAGASSEEIMETIVVAVLMSGRPSVVYGCEAMEELDQFADIEKK